MSDATAVETNEVAPSGDSSELSNAELVALATKMTEEAKSKTSKPSDTLVAAVEKGEPAAEEPAEAPAEPEAPTVDAVAEERAKRLADVLARADGWKEKKAFREAQAKHEAEVARFKAEAEATKAEAAALKARLDAYKDRDPAKVLEAFERDGIPADVLAQHAVREGTPEYKAERELRLLKEEIAAMKAATETSAKTQAEEREKAQAAQQSAYVEKLRSDFVAEARNVTKYPALAKLAASPHQARALVAEAEEILQSAYAKTGQTYSNADVLEYMDRQHATYLGLAEQKSGLAASVTSPEKSVGTSAPGTIAAGKPRTLTNSMTEKSAIAAQNFDEMSDDDFKRAMKAQIDSIGKQASRG